MPKQKTLYELLTERELERITYSDIKDKPFSETTIAELQHLGLLLDNEANINAIGALAILTARELAG